MSNRSFKNFLPNPDSELKGLSILIWKSEMEFYAVKIILKM
jgi:hypothetical protein